jgi:hypothetical protein
VRADLEKAPRSTADDRAAAARAREVLRAAVRTLQGDRALAGRQLNLPDSTGERVYGILGDLRNSLGGPTGTNRRRYDEAAAEVEQASAALKGLRDKTLPDLRKRVEKAGGE